MVRARAARRRRPAQEEALRPVEYPLTRTGVMFLRGTAGRVRRPRFRHHLSKED
jgi:hypothetical protein